MGRLVLVLVLAGCGPRVVLEDGEDEASDDGPQESSSSSASTTSGGSEGDGSDAADDKGDFPPDPATSTGWPGDDEGSSGGNSGTVELCPEIEAESVYCLGSSSISWFLVGADTASSCALDLPLVGGDTSSLAWIGDDVFVCESDENGFGYLARLDLLDGTIDTSEVPCQAVADYHGRLLLMPHHSYEVFTLYDSFEAAVAGDPSSEVDVSPFASRMTVADDLLFAAWHSTHEIEVWNLATESALDSVALEGHDGWVNGMAVVDNRLFLLTYGDLKGVFLEFDATTGARVAEHVIEPGSGSGLACRRGG